MRHLVLSALLLMPFAAMAQPEPSLTPEFGSLSAKERARLAKKEQEEALQDARFQELMGRADVHFRNHRFEEALATYQEARALRPLNVYPKVKIQDLQSLIAKRKAEQEAQMTEPGAVAPLEGPPLGALDVEAPSELTASEEEGGASPSTAGPVAPRPLVSVAPPADFGVRVNAPATPLPDGTQEHSFLEGRAVVQERSITRLGVTTIYRRVTHPWGQVVHFRDGSPISEREWIESASIP